LEQRLEATLPATAERWQDAADAYEQAVWLRPDDMEGQRNLGIALDKLGRHSEALDNLRRAIEQRPTDAEARFEFKVPNTENTRFACIGPDTRIALPRPRVASNAPASRRSLCALTRRRTRLMARIRSAPLISRQTS
jgi:tetratricopeptide (TPR) repeat protein